MTLPRRSLTAARALLAGLLVFSLVSPCAAQRPQAGSRLKQLPPDILIPHGRGMDTFRRLLFEFGFHPLMDFDHLRRAEPSKSILIVLGDPQCLSRDHFPNGLQSFVQQGGAVLIATDKATRGEAGQFLSELAGVRVTGETLLYIAPANVYNNSPYCPFVQPDATSTAVFGALAAVMDVGGPPDLFRSARPGQPALDVATNAPSRLKTSESWLPGGIHRLAYLPRFWVDEAKFSRHPGWPRLLEKKPEQSEKPLFAVGGTLGKGRVLVLADHSIFINRMILPRGTGNLEFTANCLHWLRGGASTSIEILRAANSPQSVEKLLGQRDKVLLWDDGSIRKDFEVPMKTLPIKPSLDMAPAVVAALDRTLTRMEDENVFNRNLHVRMEDLPGGQPRVVRYAVYALTLAAILLLSYLFLWRGSHRHESAAPALARAVSRHEPKASLLEQRRQALLRSGNVWDMAHRLVRQYFESVGIPLTGDSPPRVTMRGGWWQRQRVARRVARLWELARSDTPVLISPGALNRWLRDLEELKTALANGTIKLTGEQPT